MAYGQNDHDYDNPRKGETFLEIIQKDPEYSGYVEDANGNLTFFSGASLDKTMRRFIAQGNQGLTPNEVMWRETYLKWTWGTGDPNKDQVSAVEGRIFHEMFGHLNDSQ